VTAARALVAALAIAASVTPVAAQIIARPPNGTYTYNVVRRGKTLATAQIGWGKNDDGAILVTETTVIGDLRYYTETTFDPATMHERTYKGGSAGGGQANAVLDDDTATMTFEGDARSFRIIPGTSSIMIDDALVSFSAALPAVVHADTANGITAVITALPAAAKVQISPTSKAPPSDLPAGDVGIDVILNNSQATLWYGKSSLVLDRLEDLTRKITIDRVIP
jgi:hypothetical protein